MKLSIPKNCGNSPKGKLIKELTIHFASYDIQDAMAFMDEDVVWTLVGDKPVIGRDRFEAELHKMKENKASELTIFGIVTHGWEAAVHGEMKMEDGSLYGFSDFYVFTSAMGKKVRSITSYVIPRSN